MGSITRTLANNLTTGLGVAGSLTLLSTTTASNDASVTIGSSSLFSSTYKAYKIIGINIIPVSDGVHGHARVSIAGSVKTSANYAKTRIRMYDGSGTINGYVAPGDENQMNNFWGESIGTNTGESANFECIVYNPASTTIYTHFQVTSANRDLSPNTQMNVSQYAYIGSTAAIDGLQLYFSSGNIDSGTFKLYGIS